MTSPAPELQGLADEARRLARARGDDALRPLHLLLALLERGGPELDAALGPSRLDRRSLADLLLARFPASGGGGEARVLDPATLDVLDRAAALARQGGGRLDAAALLLAIARTPLDPLGKLLRTRGIL